MLRRGTAIVACYAILIAALFFGARTGTVASASSFHAAFAADQVIVGFTGDATAADRDSALAGVDATGDQTLDGIGAIVARVRPGTMDRVIASLKKHSKVRYAEPNYLVHAIAPKAKPSALIANDPRFSELWGLKNTGQVILGTAGTAGADISAETAWNTTTGSASVIVGVVDTGIDYAHPDLAANVWSNPGVAGCPAGTHGYNAIARTCDPMDDHYHGTHVSGTIGAVGNNGIGVVGVNWTVKLMGLKFLNASGSGTTADAISAIDFAVNAKIAGQNVRVLSNSWGGGAFSQAMLDVINRANANNILFVAAAGNDGFNNDVTPHYPSSYNTPNMVAVAATDNRDGTPTWTNYGATSVHLGAPGVNILSTMPASAYDYLSGTSMATPHVSGVAALVLAVPAYSASTVAQLKARILNNVDLIPSLAGRTTTGGRLNAAKAVGAPGPTPTPAPTPTPVPTPCTEGSCQN
jgi:subtilisin family serine protease